MKNQRKFQELDSLRFVAVIAVLFLHFGTAFLLYNNQYSVSDDDFFRSLQIIIGSKGVPLFFSISGFLIVYLLKRNDFNNFNFFEYLKRRLIRLYPPYILALLIFFIVQCFFSDKYFSELFLSLVTSFFYLHDIVYNHWSYILPVAWSLEIEIQFYLLAPLILLISSRINSLLFTIIMYVSITIFFNWYVFFDFRNVFWYLKFFLPGMIVAEVYVAGLLFKKKIWFYDIVFLISFFSFFSFSYTPYDSLILCFLLFSVFNLKYLKKIINNKVFNFIGQISFSVYLLHYPLFHFFLKYFSSYFSFGFGYFYDYAIQFLLFVPFTIILIYPFYLIVERPFLYRIGFKDNFVQVINSLSFTRLI